MVTITPPFWLNVASSNSAVFLGLSLLPDGSLTLNGAGPTGGMVRLEAADDLAPNRVWVPLATNSSGKAQFQFILPDLNTHPRRFYRMLTLF
jgi:hypothetical protein